jgi:hypothetical protein
VAHSPEADHIISVQQVDSRERVERFIQCPHFHSVRPGAQHSFVQWDLQSFAALGANR